LPKRIQTLHQAIGQGLDVLVLKFTKVGVLFARAIFHLGEGDRGLGSWLGAHGVFLECKGA
jgi:hypothetical protein